MALHICGFVLCLIKLIGTVYPAAPEPSKRPGLADAIPLSQKIKQKVGAQRVV